MVAKTYQSLEVVGDVYTAKGRAYVQVRTKNGALKQVRWYTEKEYAKMYPDEVKTASKDGDPHFKTQKEVLGFDKGYITIFKGNTYEDKEYFKMNVENIKLSDGNIIQTASTSMGALANDIAGASITITGGTVTSVGNAIQAIADTTFIIGTQNNSYDTTSPVIKGDK